MAESGDRRRRALRRAAAGALLVISASVAVACSSANETETGAGSGASTSSSTVAPASSGSAAPSTAAPGTTEVAPSPDAVAATLTAADLGAGWANYPEGAVVYGEDEDGSCVEASGLTDDLPDGSTDDGAIIQYGDRLVFVQSNVRVFPTPAEAQAYAAYLLTDTYVECRRSELERGLPESDPPLSVASTGTYAGDGTTAYVGAFTYETQQIVEGVAQPAGAGSRHVIYVKGNVVIDVFSQFGYAEGDPEDLAATTDAMIDEGMATVLARVAG